MHPDKPGRFVLAIECDGASYHSAPTARDRDRLRQQQLEALGWRFHRIWSTDWFLRRDEEVRRALKAFAEAVSYADSLDSDTSAETLHAVEPRPTAESSAAREREARPKVWPGYPIDDYSDLELQSLVRWVLSDGRLPTDEEIIGELTRELGFKKKGARIVAALTAAIRASRRLPLVLCKPQCRHTQDGDAHVSGGGGVLITDEARSSGCSTLCASAPRGVQHRRAWRRDRTARAGADRC